MKKIHFIYNVCLLLMLSGCGGTQPSANDPMQNEQLGTISPSGKPVKEKGFLQKSYESWEKEEWEPMTEQHPTSEKNASHAVPTAVDRTEKSTNDSSTPAEINASKTFTLQYYFDKWGRYLDEKKKQETGPSHAEKLNNMPAIGGTSR